VRRAASKEDRLAAIITSLKCSFMPALHQMARSARVLLSVTIALSVALPGYAEGAQPSGQAVRDRSATERSRSVTHPRSPVRRHARNTGVPAGTSLRKIGSLVVRTNGVVITGKDVKGCIDVRASNVTIRRTRIRCPGWYGIRLHTGHKNLLVEDVEIDGMSSGVGVAIGFSNYTLRRANIHHVVDGPRMGDNTVVEDSYIHHLDICRGCHNDGIQSGGGRNLIIRRNNIQHPHRQTAAIFLTSVVAPIDNVLISGNVLNGGNYTIYAGEGTGSPNIRVRGNRFGRAHVYGLLSNRGARVLWKDNVWVDTGRRARA